MSTIHHEIVIWFLTSADKQQLKTICQAWTRLTDNLYVVDHSEELVKNCPVCSKEHE